MSPNLPDAQDCYMRQINEKISRYEYEVNRRELDKYRMNYVAIQRATEDQSREIKRAKRGRE